jgi:hypothetical protein
MGWNQFSVSEKAKNKSEDFLPLCFPRTAVKPKPLQNKDNLDCTRGSADKPSKHKPLQQKRKQKAQNDRQYQPS